MIFINGERIDVDKKSPIYLEYQTFIEETKKRNRPIVFKYKHTKVYDTTATGGKILRKKRVFNLPIVDTYNNDEIWYYDPSINKIEVDVSGFKRITGKKSIVYVNGQITLHPSSVKDIELAFFIFKFSSLYRMGLLELVDEVEVAEKRLKIEELVSKVRWLIFMRESPISREMTGSEEVMRNLAIKWGVTGTDNLNYAQVRIALWNAVTNLASGDKISYYEKFIEDVEMTKNTYIIGLVNYAIEKRIIEYDSDTFEYVFKGLNDERIALCNVKGMTANQSLDRLVNFIMDNDVWVGTLEERLKVYRKEDYAFAVQELQKALTDDNLNWNDVAKICKKYDIKTVTVNGGRKSREELNEEIRNKIKELTR